LEIASVADTCAIAAGECLLTSVDAMLSRLHRRPKTPHRNPRCCSRRAGVALRRNEPCVSALPEPLVAVSTLNRRRAPVHTHISGHL